MKCALLGLWCQGLSPPYVHCSQGWLRINPDHHQDVEGIKDEYNNEMLVNS